jgi:hypothetical protein
VNARCARGMASLAKLSWKEACRCDSVNLLDMAAILVGWKTGLRSGPGAAERREKLPWQYTAAALLLQARSTAADADS